MSSISSLYSNAYSEFSTHPRYNRRIFDWLFLRDAIEGESAIKFKNELYLPMPSAMILVPPVAVPTQRGYHSQFYGDDQIKELFSYHNPNYHPNPAYSAYLTRAQFPELCSYTLRGLIGLSMKKAAVFELPPELEYIREIATPNGMTLEQYFVYLLEEILSMGRIISVLDILENTNDVVFSSFAAESCINWQYKNSAGENTALNALRLLEREEDNFESTTGVHLFNSVGTKVQNIVELQLINNVYTVTRYENKDGSIKKENPKTTIVPNLMGKTLNYIPAVCMGSLNTGFDIDPAPMLPIARNSQHIYMKSADLSQSQFMSCSPMLVGVGVNPEEKPVAIGSTVFLSVSNPGARIDYTKTDTSALSHVKENMRELYSDAVNMGAQLLDSSPKPAETAETTRMKLGASTATLFSSLKSAADGLTTQLKRAAIWKGGDPSKVRVLFNKDFIPPVITAAEIREIVQSWMNDGISKQTLFTNMQKAGIIPEETTFEQENKNIKDEYIEEGSPKFLRRQSYLTGQRGGKKDSESGSEDPPKE